MKATCILSLVLVAGTPGIARALPDSLVIRDAWRQRDAVERQHLERDTTADTVLLATLYLPSLPGVVPPPRGARGWKDHEEDTWVIRSPEWLRDRLLFGFTKFTGRGWKDHEGFMELDWSSSFTVQYNNFIDVEIFSGVPCFSGVGLEYSRLVFARDITVRRAPDGSLVETPLASLGVTDPRRSVFKVLYLTLPLIYEIQSARSRELFASIGLVGGMRLYSRTKIVHDDANGEKRKIKQTRSYAMNPFKLDLTARVGLKFFRVWASKSLTPMFNTSKAPRVYPFTIGVSFSD
jgi:hypothetical protein